MAALHRERTAPHWTCTAFHHVTNAVMRMASTCVRGRVKEKGVFSVGVSFVLGLFRPNSR